MLNKQMSAICFFSKRRNSYHILISTTSASTSKINIYMTMLVIHSISSTNLY